MTTPFRRLLRAELRECCRQPLGWAVLLLLFAAMVAAALNGAARVDRERSTLQSIRTEQAKAVQNAQAAAVRYARPSDLKIDYHRDPTDAFGYMNYFLVTHAIKPPLPLASLAVGQSDLLPYQVRVDFNSVFPDAAYDLDNPHALRLGAFDLAFVLVFLVPLGLIALAAPVLSSEHDSGILRLIAAQPARPRTVAAAKYAAVAIFSVIGLVGGAALALVVSGGFVAHRETGLVALIFAFWIVMWIAVTALVATFWRGTVRSISLLVSIWAAATLLLPTAVSYISEVLYPAPSRPAYIDASRQATDAFYEKETARHAAWLAAFGPADPPPGALESPAVKRFARDAFYRQWLTPWRDAFAAHDAATHRLGERLRWLSPALVLDDTLQTVAGTDRRRHGAFLQSADRYVEQLRRFFEPLALGSLAEPVTGCAGCPGRLNFTRYGSVPDYQPAIDREAGLWRCVTTLAYLALLTGAAMLLAARRLRTWPQ